MMMHGGMAPIKGPMGRSVKTLRQEYRVGEPMPAFCQVQYNFFPKAPALHFRLAEAAVAQISRRLF